MSDDSSLAERVRSALAELDPVEKTMFGGLAWMVNTNMAVGLTGDGRLLVRVGKDGMDEALARGAEPMQMGERTMTGFVVVPADRLKADEDLADWVSVGVGVATALPPKTG